MSEIITNVYIDNNFYKTFSGKDIKAYFIDWDGKLSVGKVIKTTDGEARITNAEIGNPNKNNGNKVVDVYLELD